MTPRRIGLLLLVAWCLCCGPGARDKALRGSLLATDAAAAAFVSYNRDHQARIVDEAANYDDGLSRLNAWHQERAPLVDAIRLAYRLIATAAIDTDTPLTEVLATVDRLVAAVETLTGRTP